MGDRYDTGSNRCGSAARRAARGTGGVKRIAADGSAHGFACEGEADFRAGGETEEAETGLTKTICQIGIGRRIEHTVEEMRAGTNRKTLERAAEILGKRWHAGKRPDGEYGGIVPIFAIKRGGIRETQIFIEMTDRAPSASFALAAEIAAFIASVQSNAPVPIRAASAIASPPGIEFLLCSIPLMQMSAYFGSSGMIGTSKAPDLMAARLASIAASASAGATPLT